jgi:hypothetical protein
VHCPKIKLKKTLKILRKSNSKLLLRYAEVKI